jgi:hypothetical protein
VSEPFEPVPGEDGQPRATIVGEQEHPAVLPALVDPARIVSERTTPSALSERSSGVVIPAVQAAAVAAGGFVAGAAVVGLVHRRRRRSAALGKGRRGARVGSASRGGVKGAELLQIVGSRSLLVDVHLLGGRGGDR